TTTGVLSVGGSATGTIENLADSDWFAVELSAGTTYVFTMSSSELSTPYIALRNSNGSLLENDFKGSSESQAEFSYQPTVSETYYLDASQLGDDDTGSYTVSAAVGNDDD
ncbi:hypothetical protein J3998_13170, partial [Thiomicrorhabdus sp. 6S2-11]